MEQQTIVGTIRYRFLTTFYRIADKTLLLYDGMHKGGDYMADIKNLGRKMKGKYQQMKGELQQNTGGKNDFGAQIKGGFTKAKGKINETLADNENNKAAETEKNREGKNN
jgi:hypothetical protein